MTNFIFKSPRGLIKNSPINPDTLYRQLALLLREQVHQRSDLKEIKLMLNKLLIDKHLQMQVDEYFEHDKFPEDSKQEEI